MKRSAVTSCLENSAGRNQIGVFPLLMRQGLSQQLIKLSFINLVGIKHLWLVLQAKWAHGEDN